MGAIREHDNLRISKATLEQLNLVCLIMDKGFNLLWANSFVTRKMDWVNDDLKGFNFFDKLIVEADRTETHDLLKNGLLGNTRLDGKEITLLAKNGSPRTIVLNSAISDESQGGAITLVGEDITRRRRTEAALAKSNSQLQDLVDNTSDLIQLISLDGKFIFVNREWFDVLGYRQDELASLTIWDIVDPTSKEHTEEQLAMIEAGKPMPDFETVFLSREGKRIFLTGSVNCRYDNHKPVAFRCILHDFTAKIRAEKAQRLYYSIASRLISTENLEDLYHRIHEELGEIIDAKNFFIALYDARHSYIYFPYYVDEYFQKNVRFTKRKLGNGLTEYAISANKPLFLLGNDIDELAKTDSLYLYGVTPMVMLCVPLRIGDRITGIIGVKSYTNANIYDKQDLELLEFISGQVALAIERKQNEEELNKYSARLNAIFDSSSHLIWSVNKSLRLTSFNQNYANLIEEKSNLRPVISPGNEKMGWRLLGASNRRSLEHHYRLAFRGEQQYFEMKLALKGGTEMWLEFYLNPILLSGGVIEEVSGIARDITRRKSAEINLRQSEEKFRSIFENLQDIYIRVDRRGLITMVSPSIFKRTGWKPSEVLGKPLKEFYNDQKLIKRVLTKLRDDNSLRNIETSFKIKDGTERQFMLNLLLFNDESGKAQEIALLARDISELKRNERELRTAKEQAERSLKVKEGFLANMSHEIRTPMNGVMGMVDLLATTRLDIEQKDYVQTIKHSSETLLNILNDILDLSKIEAGKMVLSKTPTSFRDTLEKLTALFGQTAKNKGNTLKCAIKPGFPEYIVADQTRLLQILSNLTSNALKFTENGEVNVFARVTKQVDNNVTVKVEVRDTGIGITPADQKMLFTSFTQVDNSSRKTFGGTGLGLAISKQLAALMDGEVGVNSKPGTGSTFWFTFVAEETKQLPENNTGIDGDAIIDGFFGQSSPKILLVDDNAVNRRVAGEILKKAGAKVDLAASGFEAITKVEKAISEKNMYDVIYMDIQMPDMDGIETTLALKKKFGTQLPLIVAMTAYSMKEDREKFLGMGMDDYLAKPIRAQQLLRKTAEIVKIKPLGAGSTTALSDTPNNSVTDILNPDIVKQLFDIGGEDLVISVYEDFLSEAGQLIENLQKWPKDNDMAEVQGVLHTLKGSAGTIGATQIADLARLAEAKVKTSDIGNLESLINQIFDKFQSFKSEYRELIEQFLKLKVS